jgi:predicted CoA-binding protein
MGPNSTSRHRLITPDFRRGKPSEDAMTTLKQVEDFLALKRVAVVGVSRDPKHFNRVMWEEFRQRRYDAVPVNPNATEIDGQKCYASVKEIDPPVEGVLIMTSRKDADQAVRDCAEAGIKNVWLYGGMAPGASSKSAKALCDEMGLSHVDGLCPYMFLPDTPAFHGPHRVWKKLTGSYPKKG